MTEIIQKGNSTLRQVAPPVPLEKINSRQINEVIAKMNQALNKEEDGVAIAAPQIGESWRIFVVSGKVFSETNPHPNLVFINPEIKKSSRNKNLTDEGCLSVRWIYGQVERAEKITLEALDEKGKKIVRHASGLLAQIFQHEIDHLNGVLFIDKARNLQEIRPEDLKNA